MKLIIDIEIDENKLSDQQKAEIIDNVVNAMLSQINNEGLSPEDSDQIIDMFSVSDENNEQNVTKVFNQKTLKWEYL